MSGGKGPSKGPVGGHQAQPLTADCPCTWASNYLITARGTALLTTLLTTLDAFMTS